MRGRRLGPVDQVRDSRLASAVADSPAAIPRESIPLADRRVRQWFRRNSVERGQRGAFTLEVRVLVVAPMKGEEPPSTDGSSASCGAPC